MLVTRQYALARKLESFSDLKIIGGENHNQRLSVVDEQLVKPEEIDGENVLGNHVQLDTGVFQLVPFKSPANGKKRNSYYIVGPSESGKTVFASKICREYMIVNPHNKLVWITPLADCPEMLSLNPILVNIADPEMVQLNIYDEEQRLRVVDNPENKDITQQTSTFQNSMVIYDDIELTEDPKLIKTIYQNLINPMLIGGRHFNISVILIKHHGANYKETRTALLESEYITVFPRKSTSHSIRHLLSYYIGLRNDQISDVLKSSSRSVTLRNRYPIFTLSNDTFEYLT